MESWLRPMLCGTADVVPEGPKWVIEGKLDGWRLVCHRERDSVRVFAGRNGSNYSGQVPYVEAALLDVLPPDTAVDGELVGRSWNDVQSVMTRGGGPHTPSKALPALTYVIFDVTRLAGEDVRAKPWSERRALLDDVFRRSPNAPSHVNTSPYAPASQAAHEAMLNLGLEGSVCKRTDSRYVNSRSNLWVKIKPQGTAEAKVVGFKPGKAGGQFGGMIGAFEVAMLDTGARTTVKCGTNERHREATEHPDRWLNVVIEIKHHGFGATGVPRSPQFLRRRDDRDSAEAPVQRTVKEVRMSAPSPRNYGAMKDEKLLRVMRELELGGDAAERCTAKGFAPADDLVRVRQIADSRGLQYSPAA